MPNSIWVLSELFPPEETSTGHFMSKVASGLSERWTVRVLCAQPTYSRRGVRAPREEQIGRLRVTRCWSTTLDKNVLPFKICNAMTFVLSVAWRLIVGVHRGDAVLVVTNPPVLPILAGLVCTLRRVRCVLFVHDVYPDVVVASGLLSESSVLVRAGHAVMQLVYRAMTRIVTIGRDMKVRVEAKLPQNQRDKVVLITHWADVDTVRPAPRDQNALLNQTQLTDSFVVQYAGNMGYPNDLKTIIETAYALQNRAPIKFLFIGAGVRRPWLEKMSAELPNVIVMPPRPRADQQDFLNACDVALISLVEGMAGIGVPSRLYNILAAGKPVVALCDRDAEPALVVEEARIGWVVAPGDSQGLTQALIAAASDHDQRAEMGRRARALAESHYSFDHAKHRFEELFLAMEPQPPSSVSPQARSYSS